MRGFGLVVDGKRFPPPLFGRDAEVRRFFESRLVGRRPGVRRDARPTLHVAKASLRRARLAGTATSGSACPSNSSEIQPW